MTHYSREQKAEAIALVISIGQRKAARQLAIPARTISDWMRAPAASPIIAAAERTMAERTIAAHEKALTAVEGSLTDPSARLGEKAQALRVLGEQANLAQGRATANVAYRYADSEREQWPSEFVPLTPDQERIVREHIIRALDELAVEVTALDVARVVYMAALEGGVAAPVAIAETALLVTAERWEYAKRWESEPPTADVELSRGSLAARVSPRDLPPLPQPPVVVEPVRRRWVNDRGEIV